MARRRFRQVDVFAGARFGGNPLAVVVDGEGIDDDTMRLIARWTNLSETTFLLPPTNPAADYRVRIFTSADGGKELPFAGHPTIGSCHAWLESGGHPAGETMIQECPAGLVELRRVGGRLAFAGPPLIRSGPVDPAFVVKIAGMLGIEPGDVVDAQWVDNGPGWVAVLLGDAAAVLALQPGSVPIDLGVVGLHPPGGDVAYEVRAFFPKDGLTTEDPVTGSLNASLAAWLIASGRVQPPYVARQGTALDRHGRIHIDRSADGRLWVGGDAVTHIAGEIEI